MKWVWTTWNLKGSKKIWVENNAFEKIILMQTKEISINPSRSKEWFINMEIIKIINFAYTI